MLSTLACAGARTITVVDHDRVEGHNLQRQVLYTIADVGAPKVEAAAFRLRSRIPSLRITAVRERLEPAAAEAFVAALPPEAIVLECTDAPALKFAINDALVTHRRRGVIGAALGWRGQAMAVAPDTACYRCVYEAPPPAQDVPTCAEAGVVGACVGLAGQLMAGLAVGLARGEAVAGRLLHTDLLGVSVRELAPTRRASCPAGHEPHAACAPVRNSASVGDDRSNVDPSVDAGHAASPAARAAGT